MFERFTKTEAEKDAEAREGLSPDQIAALRLAAVILAINAVLILSVSLLFRENPPLIGIGIGLGLAYYLFKLRPRAEALALGLTILGALLQVLLLTVSAFRGGSSSKASVLTAFVESLPSWGTVGALFLLLTGTPTRTRRAAAVALYLILAVGLYSLAVIGHLASNGPSAD